MNAWFGSRRMQVETKVLLETMQMRFFYQQDPVELLQDIYKK